MIKYEAKLVSVLCLAVAVTADCGFNEIKNPLGATTASPGCSGTNLLPQGTICEFSKNTLTCTRHKCISDPVLGFVWDVPEVYCSAGGCLFNDLAEPAGASPIEHGCIPGHVIDDSHVCTFRKPGEQCEAPKCKAGVWDVLTPVCKTGVVCRVSQAVATLGAVGSLPRGRLADAGVVLTFTRSGSASCTSITCLATGLWDGPSTCTPSAALCNTASVVAFGATTACPPTVSDTTKCLWTSPGSALCSTTVCVDGTFFPSVVTCGCSYAALNKPASVVDTLADGCRKGGVVEDSNYCDFVYPGGACEAKHCVMGGSQWDVDDNVVCVDDACPFNDVFLSPGAIATGTGCEDGQVVNTNMKCTITSGSMVCDHPACELGHWSTNLPRCAQDACLFDAVTVPAGAQPEGTGCAFGFIVFDSDACDFELTGSACETITCSNGAFDVTAPTCLLDGCVVNDITLTGAAQFPVAGCLWDKVVADGTVCDVEEAGKTCQKPVCSKGVWSFPNPTCEAGACLSEDLTLTNGETHMGSDACTIAGDITQNNDDCEGIVSVNGIACEDVKCMSGTWGPVVCGCLLSDITKPASVMTSCIGPEVADGVACDWTGPMLSCGTTTCNNGVWDITTLTCNDACAYDDIASTVTMGATLDSGNSDLNCVSGGMLLVAGKCKFQLTGASCKTMSCNGGAPTTWQPIPMGPVCRLDACSFDELETRVLSGSGPTTPNPGCHSGEIVDTSGTCHFEISGGACRTMTCNSGTWTPAVPSDPCEPGACAWDELITSFPGATAPEPGCQLGLITSTGGMCSVSVMGVSCGTATCNSGTWDLTGVVCPAPCDMTLLNVGMATPGPACSMSTVADGTTCSFTQPGMKCDPVDCVTGMWSVNTVVCRPACNALDFQGMLTGTETLDPMSPSECATGGMVDVAETCKFSRAGAACVELKCNGGGGGGWGPWPLATNVCEDNACKFDDIAPLATASMPNKPGCRPGDIVQVGGSCTFDGPCRSPECKAGTGWDYKTPLCVADACRNDAITGLPMAGAPICDLGDITLDTNVCGIQTTSAIHCGPATCNSGSWDVSGVACGCVTTDLNLNGATITTADCMTNPVINNQKCKFDMTGKHCNTVQCKGGVWDETDIICVVECGYNKLSVPASATLAPGSHVNCSAGMFVPEGDACMWTDPTMACATKTCSSSSTWTPALGGAPVCEPDKCAFDELVLNAATVKPGQPNTCKSGALVPSTEQCSIKLTGHGCKVPSCTGKIWSATTNLCVPNACEWDTLVPTLPVGASGVEPRCSSGDITNTGESCSIMVNSVACYKASCRLGVWTVPPSGCGCPFDSLVTTGISTPSSPDCAAGLAVNVGEKCTITNNLGTCQVAYCKTSNNWEMQPCPTAAPTSPPDTPAPDTPAPPTAQPTTAPDTPAPDTSAPDTAEPTSAPDTDAPDTDAPATYAPDTDAPDTDSPATDAPDTDAPDTDAPATDAPDTDAPDTTAPDTTVPDTNAPDTTAPDTLVPDTVAPDTDAPDTNVPDTTAPDTLVPDTSIPDTNAPNTIAPDTQVPKTFAPNTDAPDTLVPKTSPPATPAPETTAPDTAEPTTAPATPVPDTQAPKTTAPATYPPNVLPTPIPPTYPPNTPPTDAPDTQAPPTYPPGKLPTSIPATFPPGVPVTSTPTAAPPTIPPPGTVKMTEPSEKEKSGFSSTNIKSGNVTLTFSLSGASFNKSMLTMEVLAPNEEPKPGTMLVLRVGTGTGDSDNGFIATHRKNASFITAAVSSSGSELVISFADSDFYTMSKEEVTIEMAPSMLAFEGSEQYCQASPSPCNYVYTVKPELNSGAKDVQESREKTSAALTVVNSVVPSGASTGTKTGILALSSRAMLCPGDGPEKLDRTLNPLGLTYGLEDYKYYNGAVVGGIIINLALLSCCGIAACLLFRYINRRGRVVKRIVGDEKEYPQDDPTRPMSATVDKRYILMKARFGWLLVPLTFLFGGATVGAITAILYSESLFKLLGAALMVTFVFGFPFYVWRVAKKCSKYTEYVPYQGEKTLATKIFWGDYEWAGLEEKKKSKVWIALHHLAFDAYTKRFRYFLLIELIVIFLLSCFTAWQPTNRQDCWIRAALMTGVLLVFTLILLIGRPYIAPYENHIELLIATLETVMMFCTLAAMGSDKPTEHWGATWANTLALMAMWCIITKFLLDTIVFIIDEYSEWMENGGDGKLVTFLKYWFFFGGISKDMQCYVELTGSKAEVLHPMYVSDSPAMLDALETPTHVNPYTRGRGASLSPQVDDDTYSNIPHIAFGKRPSSFGKGVASDDAQSCDNSYDSADSVRRHASDYLELTRTGNGNPLNGSRVSQYSAASQGRLTPRSVEDATKPPRPRGRSTRSIRANSVFTNKSESGPLIRF